MGTSGDPEAGGTASMKLDQTSSADETVLEAHEPGQQQHQQMLMLHMADSKQRLLEELLALLLR